MEPKTRTRHVDGASSTVVVLAMLIVGAVGAVPVDAQSQPEKYAGRRLAEALRALETKGLRIVFSSETVKPDMRVVSEPRAREARLVLDELLVPHGLAAKDGPRGVIQVIRAKPAQTAGTRKSPAGSSALERQGGATGARYTERVTVNASEPDKPTPGVASEMSLGRGDVQDLRGILVDDPLRTVQSLPRVATGDDFRSEFSVRGSPYRHVGVVVDGVATPWLQHEIYRGGDTGSVTMFGTAAVGRATLDAGAYPQRYGDRLGAQLELTLREGSRTGTQVSGGISTTNAMFLLEGPIGRSERGSWLVTLRQSHLEWPVRQLGKEMLTGSPFGFSDALAKVVWDVRPTQQFSFTALGGRSRVDELDNPAASGLVDGTNLAGVINLGWRSTFGSSLVLNQRAYLVEHRFFNMDRSGSELAGGLDRELSYRADVSGTLFGGVFEAGGQVQRMHGVERLQPSLKPARYETADPISYRSSSRQSVDGFDGSSWQRSGYAQFTWNPTHRLTLTPGLRVTDNTLVRDRTVARWILGEWSLGRAWTLHGSAGVSHQFPEFDQVLGEVGSPGLGPERATHLDIGIEQRLGTSGRWQATLYSRDERDILRAPDANPRLVDGVITEPADDAQYENALSGSSRGAELLLERRTATGISGWFAYSYGRTRHSDLTRHETFWADFDQRHAINASGVYRLSNGTSFALTFRGGTNFPIPEYLVAREGGLFVGDRRNEVRLPSYARLDVRATRTFTRFGRRLTIFGEILNVLNRTNVGPADGFIDRRTGRALGFTEGLIQRLPSAGVLIEF